MSQTRSSRVLGWLERGLLAIGLACLAWYGWVAVEAWTYQRSQRAAISALLVTRTAPGDQPALAHPAPVAARLGDPIGLLEIARLNVSLAVVNGDDDGSLRVAVGHLPDTPLPWEPGNSAYAGHRDTFFRPLAGIREHDEIRIATPRGDYLYRVRRTLIVDPSDVWVLAPQERPSMTLITCYPFEMLGHAPKRFIVQADLVDPVP